MTPLRAVLWLLAVGLVVTGWLIDPLGAAPLQAAPAFQAEASPTAEARQGGRRSPTPSAEELERRRARNEVELLDLQKDRLRQQMAIDDQPWRALADAVEKVGPTLVGLGLLYLLMRALAHWLPARPGVARGPDPDDEEDEL